MKNPTPALPQTTVTVAGQEYRLTALPSVKGRPALLRLTKILAPQAQAVIASRLKLQAAVTQSILEIATDMSQEDFDYFYRLFEPMTEVMAAEDFVPVTMDGQPWIGRYEVMLAVMVEHCKFNFGSFFASALTQIRPQADQSANPAPNT